jgi:hypothetical protein
MSSQEERDKALAESVKAAKEITDQKDKIISNIYYDKVGCNSKAITVRDDTKVDNTISIKSI